MLSATDLSLFVSLFAIIDSIGNIPIYISLTQDFTKEEKRKVIFIIFSVGTAILIVFAAIGNYIFNLFGITLPAFRIAGGILIFVMAFSMLHGERPKTKHRKEEIEDAIGREAVAITPLAIPLFVGPGAISVVMIAIGDSSTIFAQIWVFLAIFIAMAISCLLLIVADVLFKRMGRTGLMVITRIMGIILASIAIQFVIQGIYEIGVKWHLLS
ncbi:MAG: MarC family protein [Thermoplasmata archaeon]